MFITEQQLEGQHVRLETLSAGHIEALAEAVRDGEGWGLWYASVPHPSERPLTSSGRWKRRATVVKAECKLLMLSNLFEASQAIACEFSTAP